MKDVNQGGPKGTALPAADDPEALALADYRRQVSELYAAVRSTAQDDPAKAWRRFREARDRLFGEHPQSALTTEQRERFNGLEYFEYDSALRILALLETDRNPETLEVTLDQDGLTRLRRVGWTSFEIQGKGVRLGVYWLEGYGGGLFLPFRDRSNGEETYAGGRYLLDTIKGADLGSEGGRLVLDFNYAYNPSCAYNPRWHCPLAPPENWLEVPIRAGERAYPDAVVQEPSEDAIPSVG